MAIDAMIFLLFAVIAAVLFAIGAPLLNLVAMTIGYVVLSGLVVSMIGFVILSVVDYFMEMRYRK
jgi:hypothetical protein